MGIFFQELAGSPQERHGPDGFRAVRRFLIAWEDREAFAAEVLGRGGQYAPRPWSRYPGKSDAYAAAVSFEPADPASLRTLLAGQGDDPSALLADYSGTPAVARVEYRGVSPQDREDGPSPARGTHLSYRMEPVWEGLPLAASGWHWSDLPQQNLPPDAVLDLLLPETDHILTWRQVVGPPWRAMRELQGKVNADTFLGCPAGTLLFLGAAANKLFRGAGEVAPFCWELTYRFRERAIKHAGQAFGWNHRYRGDPPGFAVPQDADGPLFESAVFAPLFMEE
ncbi:MAG: hypothetical protein GYA33_16810 [Thermogutta sp.]|nr:hypothetical protein [Thermogutta sp.]